MKEKLTDEQYKLVRDNAPLAKFLAHKRWEMAPGVLDYEDLVSLAYQGLVTAAKRWRSYCTEHGYSEEIIASGSGFSIFSRKRIIGAILDWQKRDADHVPRSYRSDYKTLQRAGYPEKIKKYSELSTLTGLSVDRIKLVVTAVERIPVSFHEMVDEDGNVTTSEPVSRDNVEDSVMQSFLGESLAASVSALSGFQQTILALKYFEGWELPAIAVELGVPLIDVRDSHNAGVQVIRSAMVEALRG